MGKQAPDRRDIQESSSRRCRECICHGGPDEDGIALVRLDALRLNMSAAIDSSCFRRITPGIETLPCSFSLPRHRHLRPYATVVLAGSFEESGYSGRIRATAGDVLIHPALDCHASEMLSAGVKLIRLDWSDTSRIGGLYRLDDADELARIAEKDVIEATHLLVHALKKKSLPSPGQRND